MTDRLQKGGLMIGSTVVAKSTNVMDFMVFKSHFYIHKGITQRCVRQRHDLTTDNLMSVFSIYDSYEFTPY